ncbi:hypothetical protein PORY_002609 [Pneumocystis oryctolagi]|uniref:Uncharacterized protein n=1 Tax=Pneumocystis oryctolagi TaxID=42067 RepID=A0ACB7C8X9_9ASCO|nr:hypothetical protein PORY_002609 [Pneumocystis oryctolagi]
MKKIVAEENLQNISKPSIRKQFIDENGFMIDIFGFHEGEKLILQGFYEFKVVKGLVSIMSSEFDSFNTCHWYRVFSPSTHSIPIISSVSSNSKTIEINCIYSKELTSLIQTLDGFLESIICVRSFSCNLVKIENFLPFTKHIWGTNKENNMTSTYTVIIDNYSKHPLLNIPESWSSIINTVYSSNVKKAIRAVICGSKSSGKSTFTKNLINKFLTGKHNEDKAIKEVNFIETDSSQPEFSPYGIISLHLIREPIINPPFTHCTLPSLLKAHFLGNTSPQNDPKHFLLSVEDMIGICKNDVPIIINTPAWTKGIGLELLSKIINLSNCTHVIYIGLELLSKIINLSNCTHVIYIGSETNLEIFNIKSTLPSSTRLSILPSIREFFDISEVLKINATDLRTLSMVSYFHSVDLLENNYCINWNFNLSLLNMNPWIVKYDGDLNGIDAISVLNTAVHPDDFYYAINGTIMALIVADIEENNKNKWESHIIKSRDFLPILNIEKNPINPKYSHCLGLCILRGISIESRELQILTPISTFILNKYLNTNKKLILMRGCLEMPICLMFNYKSSKITHIDWIKAPYLSIEDEGIGSKAWHPRRNIERTTVHI